LGVDGGLLTLKFVLFDKAFLARTMGYFISPVPGTNNQL
jgi:hypothetical protein